MNKKKDKTEKGCSFMKLSELNLINPPKKYRPMPFWSWNSKLDEKETILQIEEMDKTGMG